MGVGGCVYVNIEFRKREGTESRVLDSTEEEDYEGRGVCRCKNPTVR